MMYKSRTPKQLETQHWSNYSRPKYHCDFKSNFNNLRSAATDSLYCRPTDRHVVWQ